VRSIVLRFRWFTIGRSDHPRSVHPHLHRQFRLWSGPDSVGAATLGDDTGSDDVLYGI
jgi:hypothetical protein